MYFGLYVSEKVLLIWALLVEYRWISPKHATKKMKSISCIEKILEIFFWKKFDFFVFWVAGHSLLEWPAIQNEDFLKIKFFDLEIAGMQKK